MIHTFETIIELLNADSWNNAVSKCPEMNHGTGYWIWKLNRDRNKKYNHVTMYKNNMHPEKVMVTIGMSFYSLNGEQIITSYPVDGAMGCSGGGRVRKLSVIYLHNNAIIARGILITLLHCGTPEPRLSAIYIVSSVGTSLTLKPPFTSIIFKMNWICLSLVVPLCFFYQPVSYQRIKEFPFKC